MYCRDSEEPNSWPFASLTEESPSQFRFYPANQFRLFKGRSLETLPKDTALCLGFGS